MKATEIARIGEKIYEPKEQCLLTTWDNPWSPFTHFTEWMNWDKLYSKGNCMEQVDLNVLITDQMTPDEVLEEYERGIDEIVAVNPGFYRKLRAGEPL